MPFIAQNGRIEVVVPAGNKIAISSYGAGQTIIYYLNQPSQYPNAFYEASRLSNSTGTFGTFNADRTVAIEAGPTCQVEYVIGASPSLTEQAFNPNNVVAVTLNSATPMSLTNPTIQSTNAVNNYCQIAQQNKSNGASASSDVIVYGDANTNDLTGFTDIGICSSGFSDANYAVTIAGDSYLFGSAVSGNGKQGNLVIATDATGSRNDIKFATNGFKSTANVRVTIKKEGQVNFAPLAADPATPTKGDVYFNSTVNKLKVYNGTAWETVTSA